MAIQIAKDTGAKVKGITLSKNQLLTAQKRAQEICYAWLEFSCAIAAKSPTGAARKEMSSPSSKRPLVGGKCAASARVRRIEAAFTASRP